MTDKRFYDLWVDALAQPDEDMYIAEYGYPDWFDEISEEAGEVVEKLREIHRVSHMSMRDIIATTGLTQAEFAVKYCVPKRTVENWASGVNKCPDYVRLLFARELGIIFK